MLDATPLGLTTASFGVDGSGNHDVQANFLLQEVPDGGLKAMLLGMSMLSIGWVRQTME